MSGTKNEMMGGLKEGLGKITGNESLEAEGAAQKNMGKAQRKTEGAVQETKGKIKQGVGDLIDSPTLEAEGAADKAAGRVKQV